MASILLDFLESLREITSSPKNKTNLIAYVHDKGNAKLGDSLVNLIYSVAKSITSGTPTGVKVADFILTDAYKNSKWYKTKTLQLKGDKGKVADSIEALILYFWVYFSVNLNTLVNPLKAHLDPKSLHHHKKERISATYAFQILLDELFLIYTEKNK